MRKSVSRIWGRLLAFAAFAGLASFAVLAAAVIPASASALTPPPHKAELVFASGGRIMSMRADGNDRQVLTREGEPFDSVYQDEDSDPQISPDGSALLFSRVLEGAFSGTVSKIIVADRYGRSQRILLPSVLLRVSNRSYLSSPVWSADSSRVFFIRSLERGRKFSTEVRSIRADGTDLRLVSRSTMRFGKKKITGSRTLPFEIAPSPSGGQLLVSYLPIYGAKPANTFLMNPVTGNRRLLERDASGGDWSPDGSRIVFISERDHLNKSCYEGRCSYDHQIFVMKSNGLKVRRLVPGRPRGSSYSPDWSADGRRIAFSTDRIAPNRSADDEIFSISPAGKCLTRLTNGSPSSVAPAWGPDPGLNSEPGNCGDAAPRAIAEYEPGPDILGLKLPPLWLGPSFGNTLLDYMFKDGREVSMDYGDCGALNSKRCARPVSLTSGPVCEKASDSVFYDGTFRRLVKRKGALVMLSEPSGGGLETIAYSGGTETGIYTRSKFHGKKVTPADHLKLVDLMRPVTSRSPVTSFAPPVFTLSEVRKARSVLRSWRSRGSLAAAARAQGMFPRLAGAYLRFGKGLDRIGKVLTVKCKRRLVVPGSLKPR